MSARILWGAMLLGQLIFLGVVLFQIQAASSGGLADLRNILFVVEWAMLAMILPAGFLVRAIVFRKGTRDGVLAPAAYLTGTTMLLACCAGVAFFSLVSVLVTKELWPMILPGGVAMLIHVALFPTGRQMEPPVFSDSRSA
jgi:hypothetical protein